MKTGLQLFAKWKMSAQRRRLSQLGGTPLSKLSLSLVDFEPNAILFRKPRSVDSAKRLSARFLVDKRYTM
jgi:hypothetical protein